VSKDSAVSIKWDDHMRTRFGRTGWGPRRSGRSSSRSALAIRCARNLSEA
jgi:hypothetical protein